MSTNESTQIITGHVIYNLAYTFKFQLKATKEFCWNKKLCNLDNRYHIPMRHPVYSYKIEINMGFENAEKKEVKFPSVHCCTQLMRFVSS